MRAVFTNAVADPRVGTEGSGRSHRPGASIGPSWVSTVTRWSNPLAYLSLAVLAIVVYLPSALKSGWYYDDWNLYSLARDSGGGWGHQFDACAAQVPGGRSLACAYHVTEYDLFGPHRWLYHAWVIAMLIGIAALAYAVLTRCRLGRGWAWLIAALMLVSPVSDSARMWPTGAIGQIVILLWLLGVWLALIAFDRVGARMRLSLHLLAALLSVVAMVTYEIAVPLVALNGFVYLAARRDRRALWRGVADVVLAVAFVIYRSAVNPASAESGFVVKRTVSGDVHRGWTLLVTAWRTWHAAYAPGIVGVVAVLVVIVVSAVVLIASRLSDRRLLMWSLALVAALATSALCTLTFITANDLYLPALDGTFNRLNLPATLPYVVVFIALVGMAYESAVRIATLAGVASLRWAMGGVLALVVLAVGIHQLRISGYHRGAWERSWRAQQTALAGYRRAVAGLPRNSRILGFDTPEWEAGYVPVFAASWDLRGAIDYTTKLDPPAATPFVAGTQCKATGVVAPGGVPMAYSSPKHPLYAVSPSRDKAVALRSRDACVRVSKRWGPVPLFAAS